MQKSTNNNYTIFPIYNGRYTAKCNEIMYFGLSALPIGTFRGLRASIDSLGSAVLMVRVPEFKNKKT